MNVIKTIVRVVVLAMGIVKYINHQERAAEQSAPPAEQPTAP